MSFSQAEFHRARKRADFRPMPPDFPEYAAKMGVSALRERYKCGSPSVYRWYAECGVPVLAKIPAPPPEDFAELAPLHTVSELRRIYKRGGAIISRWQKETGVKARNGKRQHVKRDDMEEIQICMTCPYPECKLVNKERCGRIGGYQ